jgi:hypothetical protein
MELQYADREDSWVTSVSLSVSPEGTGLGAAKGEAEGMIRVVQEH